MATSKPVFPVTPYLWYPGALSSGNQADSTKMTNGWNTIGEKPLRDHMNGLFKNVTAFMQHVNDYGVPHWDTDSSYLAGSWARSTVDNKVYVCILDADNTRGEPSATATYWTRFDLYFSPQATETVQGSAEVATDAEAQGLVLDTRMMTPLKLKNAFKGTNQSLAANGFQKLPGGLIIQCGTATVTSSGTSTTGEAAVTFPVAFPSALVNISLTLNRPSGAATGVTAPYFRLQTVSGFNAGLDQVDSSDLPYTVHWQALGY